MANNGEFKIENDVPVPSGGKSKYPFRNMKIGDSFFVASADSNKIASAASYWTKRHDTKFTFTVRKVDGGTRVWRTS